MIDYLEENFVEYVNEYLSIRFLCELINQGKRLVFTGNNMISLCVACYYTINIGYLGANDNAFCIVHKLWTLPYFSADILRNNVVAIIFDGLSYPGYTPVLPFEESVHVIYILDDIINSAYNKVSYRVNDLGRM